MVLSVKEAMDRRQQTEAHLREHGVHPQFHVVDRHPTNGALGCLDGHLQIIEHAKEQQWPMVLILEDDVEIDTESLAHHNGQSLTLPEDWTMLYLGGHCHDVDDDVSTTSSSTSLVTVLRIRDTLTTHAYLVRSTLYDVILEQRWVHHCAEFSTLRTDSIQQLQYPLSKSYWSPLRLMHSSQRPFSSQVDWSKRAIDIFYAHYLQPHYPCYMVYPMLMGQRAGQSLIETTAGIGNSTHFMMVDYSPVMKWKADVLSTDRELVTIVLAIEPVGHTWEIIADYVRMMMFPTRPIHLVITWVASVTKDSIIQRYDRFTYGMPYTMMIQQVGWNEHLIVTHELFRAESRGLSLIDVSESVARQLWVLTEPWIDCSFMSPLNTARSAVRLYRTRGVIRWTYELAWFPLSWSSRFPCQTLCTRLDQPISMPTRRPLFLLNFLLTFWNRKEILSHSIVSVVDVPVIPSSTWSVLTWKPTLFRPSLLNQLRQSLVHQLTTRRPHEFDSHAVPFEHLTP